jgi:hypothetical protein
MFVVPCIGRGLNVSARETTFLPAGKYAQILTSIDNARARLLAFLFDLDFLSAWQSLLSYF